MLRTDSSKIRKSIRHEKSIFSTYANYLPVFGFLTLEDLDSDPDPDSNSDLDPDPSHAIS
jgi:hypothetical protein